MEIPKISVVINTVDRASMLDEILSSLYYLEYPNFEVIVVNGPSTDNTEEILSKYKNDIKIGRTSEKNLSISRNIGIAMASGDYVAFIDDDAIPDRKWLNKLLKAFNTPEVAGAGGDVFCDTGVEYQSRRFISGRFAESIKSDYNNPPTFPNCPYFIGCMGVNSIFRRDILLEIGGFDEQYDYFLDETDVCARIVDAGYYINYVEGADVYHKFAPSVIRDNRKVLLTHLNLVKNIVYYSNQYKNVVGQDVVNQGIHFRIDEFKYHLLCVYKSNTITKEEYEKSLQTIEDGVKLGNESVARGYRLLIKQETLQKYKADFQKFPNFFNDDFSKKKTIVFLTHDYLPVSGGIATLVYASALELVKRGHNVHVITCDEHKYDHPSVMFQENIWVHRIKTKHYDYNFLRKHTPYDIDIRDQERDIEQLSTLYSVYEEICKIQEKHNIDIVHSFCWNNLILYALNNEKLNCVITLVTPLIYISKDHCYDRLMLQVEKYCIENCQNILGDSNYIIDFCRKYYTNIEQPRTILLGLPDLSLNKFSNLTLSDKIEVLFLGRFEERKGIDLLLHVIPDICKKHNNICFRLVGDGNKLYKKDFLRKHSKLVKAGNVIFEGKVEDITPYYKNCDIFVAPSRFESFGLIYLEAMMFSKPVIGTNISAIPEVVDNNVTGILIEPEDTDGLKEAIIKLVDDPILRTKMGEAGRKRYEQKFSSKIMIDNIMEYYDKVIN